MNLRPMEVRDNLAVAQLIRASLEEFGLDKPGTVYFDSHLDHLADYYQHQERAAYFVLEDEGHPGARPDRDLQVHGELPLARRPAVRQRLHAQRREHRRRPLHGGAVQQEGHPQSPSVQADRQGGDHTRQDRVNTAHEPAGRRGRVDRRRLDAGRSAHGDGRVGRREAHQIGRAQV